MKSLLFLGFFLALAGSAAVGLSDQVTEIIPTYVQSDFVDDDGYPLYSENSIDMLNALEKFREDLPDTEYPVDILLFGENSMTVTQLAEYLGNKVLEVDVADVTYPVDMMLFEDGNMTVTELADYLGETMADIKPNTLDVADLDGVNFADPDPVTPAEAINRMAALLKTLNGGTEIP